MLYNIGANIKIVDHWVPQAKHPNDEAIINPIIKIKAKHRGSSTFVPSQHIIYTNACSLWLKVTMLSNIVNNTGTHILKKYLYGTAQRNTDTKYPHQEKSPPVAWREWRMAICQCFLGRKMSTSGARLLHTLQLAEQTSKRTIVNNHTTLTRHGTPLKHIFTTISQQWQNILGPVQWTEDRGDSIVATLSDNKFIHAYLDGSVAVVKSAHAYTIRPECGTKQFTIVGTALSPGDPDTISSLRLEHYGGMSILIWMWMLEQKFRPIQTGSMHCHIDSNTVVKRLSKGMPPSETPKTSLVTEFDLWIESATIMKKIACNMTFLHVKGHQ